MADDIGRLLEIMARLRDPDGGCPWDVQQSFSTIAPYTIEEAYEVADAIERNAMDDLRDELGDLLLQVVFHARMAEETGAFDFSDVVRAICDKMVRRHPHVFADADISTADAQTLAWEDQKDAERRASRESGSVDTSPHSILDGVTIGLPATTRAEKLQKRAARVGFDWPDARSALAKIGEENRELAHEIENGADRDRLEDELGDLLFACVNVARKLDLDPEAALRRANGKFDRRFRRVEVLASEADLDRDMTEMTLDELETLWQRAKRVD